MKCLTPADIEELWRSLPPEIETVGWENVTPVAQQRYVNIATAALAKFGNCGKWDAYIAVVREKWLAIQEVVRIEASEGPLPYGDDRGRRLDLALAAYHAWEKKSVDDAGVWK